MTLTQKSRQQGFTLVELAIVMVIIGILIGGILKGQELIATSKISATVSQIKGLDAAMNTFYEKYNALAGDMTNVNNRLPGGLAAENGNGNGVIDPVAGAAAALNEGSRAFIHLSRADLISGINIPGGLAVGGILPVVKAGGTMWLGTSTNAGGATGLGGNTLTANKTYAALNSGTGATAAAGANGGLSGSAAAQIDRKMDDGVRDTGTAQSVCAANVNGANGAYNESGAGSCSMFIRVNN